MPKPTEVAEIIAAGRRYTSWTSVQVSRDFRQFTSTLTFTAAEIGDFKHGWKTLQLKPGDPCQAYLAGQLAATGHVTTRQVAYNKDQHAARFIVQSNVDDIVKSTLEAGPGQYRKYNLQQIANSVLSPFGIGFSIGGAADGADKLFDRVSAQVGETPFELLERLCRMRNLNMIDTPTGDIRAQRVFGGEIIAELQEGVNILEAQEVWSDSSANSRCLVCLQKHGSDDAWGDDVRGQAAAAVNPYVKRYRPMVIVSEQPGDARDAQMRVNHEVDWDVATMFNLDVTVRGWLRDNGDLWLNQIGKSVNLWSPMLIPVVGSRRTTLSILGVTSSQDDKNGTRSTLTLTLPRLLTQQPRIDDYAPRGNDLAQPLPPT